MTRTLCLTFNYIKLELFHSEIMRKTIQNSRHINPSTMSTLICVKSGVGGTIKSQSCTDMQAHKTDRKC